MEQFELFIVYHLYEVKNPSVKGNKIFSRQRIIKG